MRVAMVDPSAFTPPYDHALCAALAQAGAEVDLYTSAFAYGEVPPPAGYRRHEAFYARARGPAGSATRRATKLLSHGPDMLALRRRTATADIVHFQWLAVPGLDARLLGDRPTVLTAHDLLPREPRPGQLRAQRGLYDRVNALIVHSEYGRGQLVDRLGIAVDKVAVVHHGALPVAAGAPLPPELADSDRPVVLFFGLLRPYKGIDTLLRAWRGIADAELWVVGRPMMDLRPLRAAAPAGVRFVDRFVADAEVGALFARADLVVLPYARTERFDQSGVLATALACATPAVVSDIGGFAEVAATGAAALVAPGDPVALHAALAELIADPARRARMAQAAARAAAGPYSWAAAARATLAVYERIRR
ncbi:MAG: glycosyltransferase family 4 protein [Solirubrobacterales bacterium]|nr:glycosyltransferase family 4 protein [Solirubrobacterales bacterium]